jgi:hypothetical protein
MKEFLTPDEKKVFDSTGKNNSIRNPCLLCIEQDTLCAYMYRNVNGLGSLGNKVAQRFQSIVNTPGEYDYSDSICTSQDLMYPMMMPKKNGHTLHRVDGVKFLTRTGYRQVTASSTANSNHSTTSASSSSSSAIPLTLTTKQGFQGGALQGRILD